jgi:hypothetical protein
MEKRNVEIIENGLKCDNEQCDYKDTTIKSVDFEKWIGVGCPKCGDNLLTREDFVNIRTLEMVVALTNSMTKEEINALADIDHKDVDFLKHLSEEDLGKRLIVDVNTHKNISFSNAKVIEEENKDT